MVSMALRGKPPRSASPFLKEHFGFVVWLWGWWGLAADSIYTPGCVVQLVHNCNPITSLQF